MKNKWNVPEWGFIDRNGNVVIKPQFEDTGDFSEGLAWVRPFSAKFGYIDTSGRMVIKPKLDDVENFSGGLARVAILGKKKALEHGMQYRVPKYGYIDRTGKYVWKPSY